MMSEQAETPKGYWYDLPEETVHKGVFELVDYFETQEAERLEDLLELERLYAGRKLTGLDPWNYFRSDVPIFKDGGRLKMNLSQSVVDALAAELAQHKPRATFATKRGNIKAQNIAKRRTKYVDGQFHKQRVYETATECVFDHLRVGTGVVKVSNDGAQVVSERVHASELYVVAAETIYGKTKQIHHIKTIARSEVHNTFAIGADGKVDKKLAQIIADAKPVNIEGGGAGGRVSDLILLVESYRLPVMKGKKVVKNGLRTVCVESGALVFVPWKRPRLPFAFLRFKKKSRGFWGDGVIEVVRPHQVAVNKNMKTKEEAFALFSGPWVLTDEGGPGTPKVNVSHLRNEVGAVIRGALGRVQVFTPPPMSDQVMNDTREEIGRAYEEAGVSRMAATQVQELGPDASGSARREAKDAHSQRFALQHAAYDQFILDIAQLILDETAELADTPGVDLSVEVPDGDSIEVVQWAETKCNEEMVLQCLPSNFFSTSPSAKKQDVVDAIKLGWLTREQGMKQVDFPDLQGEASLITAFQDHVDRCAGLILDTDRKKEAITRASGFWPEPFDVGLDFMADRMNRHLKRAQATDCDEWRLQLMRDWILRADAISLKRKKDAAAAAAPAAAPAGPAGAPPVPQVA
jgi:hypothetical protein